MSNKWSFRMLTTYFSLRLLNVGVTKITQLIQLRHATQKLQLHGATLQTARAYFDFILEEFPCLHEMLFPNAAIVQNSYFESAGLKLHDKKEERSSLREENEIESLLISNSHTRGDSTQGSKRSGSIV